jgi:hypothetical protein
VFVSVGAGSDCNVSAASASDSGYLEGYGLKMFCVGSIRLRLDNVAVVSYSQGSEEFWTIAGVVGGVLLLGLSGVTVLLTRTVRKGRRVPAAVPAALISRHTKGPDYTC